MQTIYLEPHFENSDLDSLSGCVLTIGSFDGLHLGHHEVFRKVNTLAELCQCQSIALTFYPHPREIVYPRDKSLRLITTQREKELLFEKTGIDYLVVIPFTIEFLQLMPQEYVEKFLIGKFNPKAVVIGYDHRFGLNREGDVHMLNSYGTQFGFDVVRINEQHIEQITISSSKIRQAILEGNLEFANKLLGYPFCIGGEVIHGRKIGNSLGFPTANIRIDNNAKLLPPYGIYSSYVRIDGDRHKGMLYIGTRPAIEEDGARSVEVHIFDFDEYIYGEYLLVEVVEFVRHDANFESLDALKKEIRSDQLLSKISLEKYEKRQDQEARS